jgi:CRP/FNR family cyclic AMP-dependent transcriptional regulator
MISPELLRRYPFFSGFDHGNLKAIAMLSDEIAVPQGHLLFYEGTELPALYLVLEGSVNLAISMPDKGTRTIIPPPTARAREVVVSVVRAGDVLAWSALVPPYKATSNARAAEPCKLVVFDARALRHSFDEDPAFGYQLVLRVAQVARDRIMDLHYETLAAQG